MPNPAKTDHPIHSLLTNRYSPRAFLDKSIPADILARIFEAARWSPSCKNEQEWRFVVGCKNQGGDFNRICSVLLDANKTWACNAAVLVLVCGCENILQGNTPNPWYAYDCGQAAAHLTFQAAAENIMVHQMAGFDAKKAIEEFSIPQGFKPLTAIAMGYAGEASQLPDILAQRESAERTRNKISQFVFSGTWEKSFFNKE